MIIRSEIQRACRIAIEVDKAAAAFHNAKMGRFSIGFTGVTTTSDSGAPTPTAAISSSSPPDVYAEGSSVPPR